MTSIHKIATVPLAFQRLKYHSGSEEVITLFQGTIYMYVWQLFSHATKITIFIGILKSRTMQVLVIAI